MRFFVPFFCALLVAFSVALGVAHADQNDPGLEALFLELKDGSVLDAETTTERIVEIWSAAPSPTVTLLYQRATEAATHGEMDLAEELVAHVTGLAPSFAQGWVLQASLKLSNGDFEAAYEGYRKALDLEPRHFIATTDLADVLYANGEDRAAFDLYQQALKWNPHYARARAQAAQLREELSSQEI